MFTVSCIVVTAFMFLEFVSHWLVIELYLYPSNTWFQVVYGTKWAWLLWAWSSFVFTSSAAVQVGSILDVFRNKDNK